MVLIKLFCFKFGFFFWQSQKLPNLCHNTTLLIFKCYWLTKSLNQAPTAINKGSTAKAPWELIKEGEMASHLGEIKKGFKELTFGLRL